MTSEARTFVRVGHYVHELFAGRAVTVGRGAECDIVLDEATASRKHCRIELVDDVVHVTDLGSRNGLLINGQRVEGSCKAYHGDVLNIGPTTLSVLRQRRSLRSEPAHPQAAPGMEATSQGTSVVDILAGGAEDALRRGDLLAAEASTRNLLTAMRGRTSSGTRMPRATVDRAVAIATDLADKTGDRSLLDKALALEGG